MSGWRDTADVRRTLKVFSWARAQHRLRCRGYPVSFAGAAALIAAETGIDGTRAAAALAGGFSSRETQAALAAWNGLRLAQKHGVPVLVADRDAATGDSGLPCGGPAPQTPGALIARLAAREAAPCSKGKA